MTSRGIIRVWHHDEGWGVIDSADVPGGCRVTTDKVKVEGVVLASGLPLIGLPKGEQVDFVWHVVDADADFTAHASAVWPSRCDAPADAPNEGAYGGSMWNSAGTRGEFRVMRQHNPTDIPPAPARPALPRTRGTVAEWNTDEGWGVLDSPDTPGGAWAHFSEVRGMTGFRVLQPGSTVEFAWESAEQDGYHFRGSDVDVVE